MQFLNKSAAALALMLTAALAGAVAAPLWALGEPTKDHDEHGGPVISGTVSAIQTGAWNVGIVGTPTVNVANAPTNEPARFGPASIRAGDSAVVVTTVPAGRVFVATDVHAWMMPYQPDQPSVGGACWFYLQTGSDLVGTVMGVALKPPVAGTLGSVVIGNEQANVAIRAGESLWASCDYAPYDPQASASLTVGGYFVTTP